MRKRLASTLMKPQPSQISTPTITGVTEAEARTAEADQIRAGGSRKIRTARGRAYVSFVADRRTARVTARRQANHNRCPVYVYALPDGGYWISQVGPDDVAKWTGDGKFVEMFEPAEEADRQPTDGARSATAPATKR